MKIMILGLSGMLGHKLFSFLQTKGNYDVYATTTSDFEIEYPNFLIFNKKNIFYSKNQNLSFFEDIFSKINPDIVINCIAVLEQSFFNLNPIEYIEINSVFPHKISLLSKKFNFRFIHFSTDIIYNDINGLSSENDKISIQDFYSASKFLGEINDKNSLTIRTSIIGHQLNNKNTSLVEWFLNFNGESVNGYSNVIYSGLTTNEISKIFHFHIIPNVSLSGVLNISSKPISKFDLLCLIKKYYNKSIDICKDVSFKSNRSLSSKVFFKKTSYEAPKWDTMIREMHDDFKNKNTN